MKKSLLIAGMAVAAMTASAQDTEIPLTVISGWQADVVAETTPISETLKLGIDNPGVGFFSKDFRPAIHPFDFKGATAVNLTSNLGHVFHFDAGANNTLQLTNATGDALLETPVQNGTFTLTTPQAFDNGLYLLATAGNGGKTEDTQKTKIDVYYNYADGSASTSETITILDWWNTSTDHTMDGFYGLDRATRLTSLAADGDGAVRLQEIKLTPTAGKTVKSIEFIVNSLHETSKTICDLFGLSAGDAAIELESGYNADVIAEANDKDGLVAGTTTSSVDADGHVLFTDGVTFPNTTTYTYGLPSDGKIAAKSGTNFQLSDYSKLNATRLSKDADMGSATLMFGQIVNATELHMLATAGNGGSGANVNVTYIYEGDEEEDASSGQGITSAYTGENTGSLNGKMIVPDWFPKDLGTLAYRTGRYYDAAVHDTDAGCGLYEFVGYPDATKNLVGVKLTYLDNGDSKIIVNAFTALGKLVATGINTIDAAKTTTDGKIFNLAGQQVSKSYKGIVIKNGKKMIQK